MVRGESCRYPSPRLQATQIQPLIRACVVVVVAAEAQSVSTADLARPFAHLICRVFDAERVDSVPLSKPCFFSFYILRVSRAPFGKPSIPVRILLRCVHGIVGAAFTTTQLLSDLRVSQTASAQCRSFAMIHAPFHIETFATISFPSASCCAFMPLLRCVRARLSPS